MIPGTLISILTFPGVIVHEFAHKKFCDWFNVKVFAVKYFQFGNPVGYVLHEKTRNYWAVFWISIGPLLINTLSAFISALIMSSNFSKELWVFFWGWLSISVGMHSFPSNQDVQNILEESKEVIKEGGNILHYLTYPLVFIVYVANLLRFFWIDAIWAIFILSLASGVFGYDSDLFNTSSTNQYNNTNEYDALYTVGDYECNLASYNKAESLQPDLDEGLRLEEMTEKSEAGLSLINNMAEEIDNIYVDEYSDYSVNSYNKKIDEYNNIIIAYEEKYSSYEVRAAKYNKDVDIYNNHLKNNCRPR